MNPVYDSLPLTNNLPENVTIDFTEEGPIVTVYEESADTTKLQSELQEQLHQDRVVGSMLILLFYQVQPIPVYLAGIGVVAGIVGLEQWESINCKWMDKIRRYPRDSCSYGIKMVTAGLDFFIKEVTMLKEMLWRQNRRQNN